MTESKLTRRLFGLNVRQNAHPDMRRLRRESGDASLHGNKFWKSSCLTMDYLQKHPMETGSRVLDLGCGWGLGGIFCASTFAAKVTLLDADPSVFPFAQYHAKLNKVEVTTWHRYYERVTESDLRQFDAIIGTDICFWDKLESPLYNLIRRALRAGVKRVLQVDPGRPPFRRLAARAQQKLGAEYRDWQIQRPLKASGCLLIAGNAGR